MSEIITILPAEARKLYINRRNVRDAHERALNDKLVDELKGIATKKGLFYSGWYLTRLSELRIEFVDALTYGDIEEAIETCKQCAIALTPQLCTALEAAARGALTARFHHIIQAQGMGVANMGVPDSAIQSINQRIQSKTFSAMPKILVMIETARLEDERKRAQEMTKKTSYTPPKRFAVGTKVRITMPGIDGIVILMDDERGAMGEYWHTIETKCGEKRVAGCTLELIPEPITHTKPHNATTYIQNINQHGAGNSVSQLGDTHTNVLQIVDMSGLKQEIATIRAALKAQIDSLEADEVLGSLASAEKAAQSNDEHGVKIALGAVTKGGWEIVKKVAPTVGSQVLLHFLKLHGMA
jgi:hypothetical protein